MSTSSTFVPGESLEFLQKCVTIRILDDDAVEDVEEFSVIVSSSGVIQAVNGTSVNVTIYEDPLDCKFALL